MSNKPNPYDHVLGYMIDSNIRSLAGELHDMGGDIANDHVVEHLEFSPSELASVRKSLAEQPGHRGVYLTVDGFTLRKPATEVSP